MLEDAEMAKARGAKVLAEIKGTGNCIEFPKGKGLSVPEQVSKSSISAALDEGAMRPGGRGFYLPPRQWDTERGPFGAQLDRCKFLALKGTGSRFAPSSPIPGTWALQATSVKLSLALGQ